MYIQYYGTRTASTQLIYVHGGPGGDSQLFEHVVSLKNDLVGGLTLFDHRGCGRSANEDVSTNSDQVDDLIRIANSISGKVIFVAHSYGCAVTLSAIGKLPSKKLSGLVLIGPVADFEAASRSLYTHSLFYSRGHSHSTHHTKINDDLSFWDKRKIIWDDLYDHLPHSLYWYNVSLFRQLSKKVERNLTPPEVANKLRNALFDHDCKDDFPRSEDSIISAFSALDFPKMIIRGEEDIVCTDLQFKKFANNLSASDACVILPSCGHFPHVERSYEFFLKLWKFVEALDNDIKN